MQFIIDVVDGFIQAGVSELPFTGGKKTKRVASLERRGVLRSTLTRSLTEIYDQGIYDMAFQQPKFLNKVGGFINQLLLYANNVFEKSTKVTSDIRLERMGFNEEMRDLETREYGGSPDFNQVGRVIRNTYANIFFPFLNPAIQGPRLDVRRFSEGGIKGTKLSRLVRLSTINNIIVPALLAYALRQLPDWKDDYEEYEKNNPTLFDNNIVIPLPFKGTRADGTYGWKYATIPLRDTTRNLNVMVTGLLKLMRENNPGLLENFLYRSVMEWNPFQTGSISNIGEEEGIPRKIAAIGKDIGYGIIAAANPLLRASWEQPANMKAYSRQPITSGYIERLLPADQYTTLTPSFYVTLGQKWGLSPIRMQYLVEEFGGSVPTDFFKMFNQALPYDNDEERYMSNSLIRRFTGVVSSSRRAELDNFYRQTDKVEKTYQSLQLRSKKQGDMKEAQAFYDAHPELKYRKAVSSLLYKMNQVSGTIREVNYNKNLTPEQKKESLRQLTAQRNMILDNFEKVWVEIQRSRQSAIPQEVSWLTAADAAGDPALKK